MNNSSLPWEYEYMYYNFDDCDTVPFIGTHWYSGNMSTSYLVTVCSVFAFGFIGNIATVAVIACWKKLHTATFTMIACLAVSDAYSLIEHLIWNYTNLLYILWNCLGVQQEVLDITSNLTGILGILSSGTQLCLLAFIRYMAIVHPLKFQATLTTKRVVVMSECGWVIVVVFSTFTTFVAMYMILTSTTYLLFYAVLNSLNCLIPASVFITLHCLKVKAISQSSTLSSSSSSRMNVVVALVLVIYVLTASSVAIYELYMYITENMYNYIYNIMKKLTLLSFRVNCAVNPFIYFISSPPFIQIVRRMRQCLICNSNTMVTGELHEITMREVPESTQQNHRKHLTDTRVPWIYILCE